MKNYPEASEPARLPDGSTAAFVAYLEEEAPKALNRAHYISWLSRAFPAQPVEMTGEKKNN